MSIQLETILRAAYLGRYDDLNDALTTWGEDEVQLRINNEIVAVASSTEIGHNFEVFMEGTSRFDVASGQTLTINHLNDPGEVKINIGAGKLVVKNTPLIRQSWHTGPFGDLAYLNEPIDDTQITFNVSFLSGLGPPPFAFSIDNEAFLCTAVSGDIATVTRGFDGTTEAAHSPSAITTEPVDISETGIDVDDASVFGAAPFIVWIDAEAMYVDSIVSDTLNVQRGYGGTSSATHVNGSDVIKQSIVYPYVSTAIRDSVLESWEANGGAKFLTPPGTWTTLGDWVLTTGSIWDGSGSDIDGASGSIYRLIGANNYVVRIGDFTSSVYVNNMTFDARGATNGKCAVASGSFGFGSFAQNNKFTNCRFNGGTEGFHVYDLTPSFSWQCTSLTFDHCWFISQSVACFKSETVNSSYLFNQCTFTPTPNTTSVCLRLNYHGPTQLNNCTFNGVNVSPQLIHTNIASINTTTGLITTVAPHACPVGELIRVTILNADPNDLPTAEINSLTAEEIDLDKQKLWFKALDATTGYVYLHPIWAFLGDEDDYRLKFIDGGTGTQELRTNMPVRTGRPFAVAHVSNTSAGLAFIECQDEGFPYWLWVDNTFEKQKSIIFQGNLIQSLVYIKSRANIVSIGNWMYANAFCDYATSGLKADANVYSFGDTATYNSVIPGYVDMGNTVQTGNPSLDAFAGNSVMYSALTPDSNSNIWKAPSTFTISHPWGAFVLPPLEATRDRSINDLPIFRVGLKESWEDRAAKQFFDFHILDTAINPTHEFMTDWLELKANPSLETYTYERDGVYRSGHFWTRGRTGNIRYEPISPTTGTVNIDFSVANNYYFPELTGDVTINVDSTVGIEAKQGQEVRIRIPTSTTNRFVTFGSGFFAGGSKSFHTGYQDGHIICKFFVDSDNTLVMEGEPIVAIPTGVTSTLSRRWRYPSGTPQTIVPNVDYISNIGGLQVFNLPTNANIGDDFRITGEGTGGWSLQQTHASHRIIFMEGSTDGLHRTTLGTGGSVASTDDYDSIHCVCIADKVWKVHLVKGNVEVT